MYLPHFNPVAQTKDLAVLAAAPMVETNPGWTFGALCMEMVEIMESLMKLQWIYVLRGSVGDDFFAADVPQAAQVILAWLLPRGTKHSTCFC